MSWLDPGKWLLYGALVAGVWLGMQRLDKSRQQIGHDRAQVEYNAKAVQASEAARAKEQALQTTVTKVSNDYQAEKRKRIADAVFTAGRLSELQAALTDSVSLVAATSSGTDDPRGAIIGECAVALVGLDGYAKSLAAKTSALQVYARDVCLTPQ